MKNPEVVYATTNPGKLQEVSRYLDEAGISRTDLQSLGVDLDPEETGTSLAENARIKAEAYHRAIPDRIIMSDDTGMEIGALDGEPGIHVRRWRDGKTRMSDAEITEYALKKMAEVPPGERGAQFRSVTALCYPDGTTVTFDGQLAGEILLEPVPTQLPGFPFAHIFYIPELKITWAELQQLSKRPEGFRSHREKSVRQAIDHIQASG